MIILQEFLIFPFFKIHLNSSFCTFVPLVKIVQAEAAWLLCLEHCVDMWREEVVEVVVVVVGWLPTLHHPLKSLFNQVGPG